MSSLAQGKVRECETPSPARETRALPRVLRPSQLGQRAMRFFAVAWEDAPSFLQRTFSPCDALQNCDPLFQRVACFNVQ